MDLLHRPSETRGNKEVIVYYFCSEIKKQPHCSDWQVSPAPAAEALTGGTESRWSAGTSGNHCFVQCDTGMHILYFK